MKKKIFLLLSLVLLLTGLFSTYVCAADVATAVENTWSDAAEQVKRVVNNVVFPIVDVVLAVSFFVKVGMTYYEYRKHGQFEWTGAAILFAGLIFSMTAPTYIWSILGM